MYVGRTVADIKAVRHLAVSMLFARSATDPTSESVLLDPLGIEHEDRHPYVASPWWILHWLLPRSDVRPGDVFVEYGCGKGRVVLAAAQRYPFSRVIGLELSPDLSATARALVAKEGRLRTRSVCIETLDATAYRVPDDMTHAYMFNPFRGETMERVCANMAASLRRAPRRLRLIYLQPEEHDTLIAHGFRLERRVRATRLVRATVAIYVHD